MDVTQTETYQRFLDLHPCSESKRWIQANRYQSIQWLWDNCPDVSWMTWIINRTARREFDYLERKKLILCCCEIARSVLHLIPKGEDRPRIAIETMERYCRGEATPEEVRAAADAARDAWDAYDIAAAYITFTARAAQAACVARAAHIIWAACVADSSLNAASACRGIIADIPAIIRRHYPECPI